MTDDDTWICAVDEENGWVCVAGVGWPTWHETTDRHRADPGWVVVPRVRTMATIWHFDREIVEGDRDAVFFYAAGLHRP